MNQHTRDKWDRRYQSGSSDRPAAAEVLSQNLHLLPETGAALDLACGRGGNALCLAAQGLSTCAWDISATALAQLKELADQATLTVQTETRDVSVQKPGPASFDVIVVSRFLDRSIMQDIKNAIRDQGLIFYQTFTMSKVNNNGPTNPDYLLNENELLHFFNDWHILVYREEGATGNKEEGFRNQAMLIAQKITDHE